MEAEAMVQVAASQAELVRQAADMAAAKVEAWEEVGRAADGEVSAEVGQAAAELEVAELEVAALEAEGTEAEGAEEALVAVR